MSRGDRGQQLHKLLLCSRDLSELRESLDALVSLFGSTDEVIATIDLCKDALRRADELALAPSDWLRYATRLVVSLRKRGSLREALELSEDVIIRAQSTSVPPNLSAGALLAAASVARELGEIDRAADILSNASVLVKECQDIRLLASYNDALGHVLMRKRQLNAAITAHQAAVALCSLIGDRASATRAAAQVARAHMLAGRLKVAAELYAETTGRDIGIKASTTIACNHAICLTWLGLWPLASRLLSEVLARAVPLGLIADESRALTILSMLAIRRGDLDEAETNASRGLELARTNGLIREELAALECLGEIAYERGNASEAIDCYTECITRGEAIGMSDATTEGKRREAEAWNHLGDYDRALAAALRCIEVAEQNEDRYEHAVVHRPLAVAHSMLGAGEEAERAFRQGITEIRELGDRFELAKTLVEFACHLRDSDPTTIVLGAAGEHLREARDIFTHLGVTRWVERTERELAEVMQLTEAPAIDTKVQRTEKPAVERGIRTIGSVSIITRSRAMHELLEQIARVAPSTLPILITGESGTGKELVARAVQELSGRPADRFIAVNCAALPKELHESELFGHIKGSFTGATAEKPGLFEQADGGTIFLDEIGDLDLGAQGKLLRVLENGEVRRVGELRSRRVDARIVAATNRDLEQASRDGRFRDDLYHRLNGLWVRIPALRERLEDIEVLVTHYLEQFQRQYGKRVRLTPELLAIYKHYSWPGNIRELRQELHRMVLLTHDGDTMQVATSQIVRFATTEQSATLAQTSGYASAIDDHERRLIIDALHKCGGNKARAARLLNMSRTTLIGKVRRLGIE